MILCSILMIAAGGFGMGMVFEAERVRRGGSPL